MNYFTLLNIISACLTVFSTCRALNGGLGVSTISSSFFKLLTFSNTSNSFTESPQGLVRLSSFGMSSEEVDFGDSNSIKFSGEAVKLKINY